MGDVSVGCVVEIKSGASFLAERGAGCGGARPCALGANERLDRMFWTYGFRGRPARATRRGARRPHRRARRSAAATFELGSATFDMTRVLTGQLDAYVEPGPRLVDDVPGMREEFERVGGGAVLNNSPYDLAAAVLCLEEAGAVVTDAHGEPLADRPLLGSGAEFQMLLRAAGYGRPPREAARAVERGWPASRRRLTVGRRAPTRSGTVSARASARRAGPQEPGRLHPHRRPAARRGDPRARRAAARASASSTLSATAFGGGVSEILYTLVPLMRDVGLEVEWQVIYGREEFFNATKLMHNALQGAPAGPHRGAVGDVVPATTR